MFSALLDFFYDLFSPQYGEINDYLVDVINEDAIFNMNGVNMTTAQYLAYICSIISLILIVIACCLFIYRLIRLVGRLFSGGAL